MYRGVFCLIFLAALSTSCTRATGPLSRPAQAFLLDLEYRHSPYPSDELGRREQQCERTAPDGLALPRLNTNRPLFVRWQLGEGSPLARALQKQTSWMVLDQSQKDGPYDLLYVDRDLDGALADESSLRCDAEAEGGERHFRYIRLAAPPGRPEAKYCLNVHIRDRADAKVVRLEAACWYEGRLALEGREYQCVLADANANGQFGDTSPNPYKADIIRIAPADAARRPDAWTDRTLHAVGRCVDVEGKLYALGIEPDGTRLQLTPAGPLPLGRVRANRAIVELSLAGTQGHFYCRAEEGVIAIPGGEYVVHRWCMERQDKESGRLWRLIGGVEPSSDAPGLRVLVKERKESVLDVGEPVLALVRCRSTGQDHYLEHEFVGRLGERVTFLVDGQPAPAPQVRITNADASYDRTFSLEPG